MSNAFVYLCIDKIYYWHMTLQQLRYIVAIGRYRSFAKAAEECGVTQPTLSGMLVKLEDELGVRIFDRSSKNVSPTAIGQNILRQAEKALSESERIKGIVAEAKGCVSGELALAVGPSIAPYILPSFIRHYLKDYPAVELAVEEMKADNMAESLLRGRLDAGMAISGYSWPGVLEIPLYTERFMVYLSESCWRKLPVFHPENLEHENMWVMKEAQCLRQSAFSFCKARAKGRRVYEAGNIETLIRIVDENGGYTIIPEMHLPLLSERQRANVRRIDGDYLSQRRVSLYIREDYIRQHMLDSIVDTMKKFMPAGMMDNRLLRHGIIL